MPRPGPAASLGTGVGEVGQASRALGRHPIKPVKSIHLLVDVLSRVLAGAGRRAKGRPGTRRVDAPGCARFVVLLSRPCQHPRGGRLREGVQPHPRGAQATQDEERQEHQRGDRRGGGGDHASEARVADGVRPHELQGDARRHQRPGPHEHGLASAAQRQNCARASLRDRGGPPVGPPHRHGVLGDDGVQRLSRDGDLRVHALAPDPELGLRGGVGRLPGLQRACGR
mmetsp:Transcript_27148/g.76696  ORF Transcript_27148/g.76696 Transcript_27148/m.76696 type:complete len:227 (-) Transcript_27148:1455-2135(-)